MKKRKILLAATMAAMAMNSSAQTWGSGGTNTFTYERVGIGALATPTDAWLHIYGLPQSIFCSEGGLAYGNTTPELWIDRQISKDRGGSGLCSLPPANLFQISNTETSMSAPPLVDILDVVNDKGWLGIKTNNPQAPLHVNGDAIVNDGAIWLTRGIDDDFRSILGTSDDYGLNLLAGFDGANTGIRLFSKNNTSDPAHKGQIQFIASVTTPGNDAYAFLNYNGSTYTAPMSIKENGLVSANNDLSVAQTVSIGIIADAPTDGYVLTTSGSGVVHKRPFPTASTPADNLGNHTATATLNMTGHDISSANTISASTLNIGTVNATGSGNFWHVNSTDVNTTTLEVTGGAGSANFSSNIIVAGTTVSSDRRFKKEIEPTGNVSETLFKVQSYKYRFIPGSSDFFKFDDKEHYGFIAQEVKNLYPHLVENVDKQGHLGVNYTEFIPLLLQAIKEQDVIIKANSERISRLEEHIAALESNNPASKSAQGQSATTIKSELFQNTPNPFDKETSIGFNIVGSYSRAFIGIYDLNGKEMRKVELQPDSKTITISAGTLNAGMYLYSLIVDNQLVDTKKMVIN